MARDRRFGRGRRLGQRHGMDRMGTSESSYTRPREGKPDNRDRRLNKDPGPKRDLHSLGSAASEHENGGIAFALEAKQISDRECVVGSRGTSV
jgi:hypothetical protein